ncbi:MAG: hypothetical protein GY935_09995 [Gammaproteobacteria bacterium]|nr:hypothetical protein [Gammaproteobacteria bacterium]
MYSASGEKSFLRAANQLETKWRQLEDVLGGTGFFGGEALSLVDAAFAPVFRYLDLFEQLVDYDFLGESPKIAQWREVLQARETVVKAVRQDYPTLLLEFIGKRHSYLGQQAQVLLANRFAA